MFVFFILINYALSGFQKCLEKIIKNVVNSRRPAIIVSARTMVLKLEYMPKFCVGPTSARPGPTLLKHDKLAVKLVTKLCPSTDMTSVEAKSVNMKNAINIII